ncbi:hypothetical protein M1446_03505 [Candidatus Dependentiae bacterium]|nr:hypothetical protein [Candidatus Dependentiae bacterium]
MNSVKLLGLLLILLNIHAVIVINDSSVNIKICSFEGDKCFAYLHVGETWEKKDIDKLSIYYKPKGQPIDCQYFRSEKFENLTDDTIINFNCKKSTVTKN